MIQYDPHLWRWTFFAIRGSMLKAITIRSLSVTLIAVALTLAHDYVTELSIPAASNVHALIGTTLGLLLVFRTNSSYDRWWEGRKIWGTIVNTCRNLARSSSVHLASQPERLRRVLALTAAWPYSAMHLLRQKQWVPDGLEPAELDAVKQRNHLPTAICERITWHLKGARDDGVVTDYVMTQLDQNNQLLVDCIGACERIHKTPLPFAYAVHLRRALMIYTTTLPLALLGTFGWWTIFIVFIVAYTMFGIEEIGVEIEDPFEGDDNDLPLEAISQNIEKNVKSFLPA